MNADKKSAYALENEERSAQLVKVEAVLRQLPLKPGSSNLLSEFAWDIVAFHRYEWRTSRGHNAAIKALPLLSKQLRQVQKTLDTLPKEATEALQGTGHKTPYVLPGARAFEEFAHIADAAKKLLESQPVKRRAGRPESRGAFETSRQALLAYEALTDKRAGITTSPTERGHPRSGAFLSFLTELFCTLSISASAESQAKKALAARESPQTSHPYSLAEHRAATKIRKGFEDSWTRYNNAYEKLSKKLIADPTSLNAIATAFEKEQNPLEPQNHKAGTKQKTRHK